MSRSVVFRLDRAKRDAVRLAFARGPPIEEGRVPGLRRGNHPNLGPEHAGAINLLLNLLVAIGERNARHRKRFASICAKKAVEFFVITGYSQLPLGLAIPRLELVVIERPVATLFCLKRAL